MSNHRPWCMCDQPNICLALIPAPAGLLAAPHQCHYWTHEPTVWAQRHQTNEDVMDDMAGRLPLSPASTAVIDAIERELYEPVDEGSAL